MRVWVYVVLFLGGAAVVVCLVLLGKELGNLLGQILSGIIGGPAYERFFQ